MAPSHPGAWYSHHFVISSSCVWSLVLHPWRLDYEKRMRHHFWDQVTDYSDSRFTYTLFLSHLLWRKWAVMLWVALWGGQCNKEQKMTSQQHLVRNGDPCIPTTCKEPNLTNNHLRDLRSSYLLEVTGVLANPLIFLWEIMRLITQLSSIWIPDPQQTWCNVCLKQSHFGRICYAATAPQYTHQPQLQVTTYMDIV